MPTPYRRKLVVTSIALLLGTAVAPAQASPILDVPIMSWSGVMTLLDASGRPLVNTSYPYYGDPTWGYGVRTPISGTLALDLHTGSGSLTAAPFYFFNGPSPAEIVGGQMQAIGDGQGGYGSLMLGNMLFNWIGAYGMPLSIVWDAAGLFAAMSDGTYITETISGVGALPASNDIKKGGVPIGPAPLATTVWNTTPLCTAVSPGDCSVVPSGGLPLLADSIGGSPFIDGPFVGYSLNLDITSLHVDDFGSCLSAGSCPPPVPVPAAVWLFGSGLFGLVGVSIRRRSS